MFTAHQATGAGLVASVAIANGTMQLVEGLGNAIEAGAEMNLVQRYSVALHQAKQHIVELNEMLEYAIKRAEQLESEADHLQKICLQKHEMIVELLKK
jgi:hypothetical protein